MFIAALFIIAQTLETAKCPSAGEWINYDTDTQGDTTQQ